MSTWIILVVAVFLNATDPPLSYSATLVPGTACDADLAADLIQHMNIKEPILGFNYSCDKAHGPDDDPAAPPAPAKKHIPGDKEA